MGRKARLAELERQVAIYTRALDRLTNRVEELERKDGTEPEFQGPFIGFDGKYWTWSVYPYGHPDYDPVPDTLHPLK